VIKRPWESSFAAFVVCAALLSAAGCSRQQSDWEKARTANNVESYEQFVKKYPTGEFTSQAQAALKGLEEERDWQKARDADTPEAYQAFLKQYPTGKWTEEARIRNENFSLAAAPAGSSANPDTAQAASAAGTGTETAASAVETPVETKAAGGTPAKPAAAKPAAHKAGSSMHAAPAATKMSGKYAVQLGAFSSGKAAAEHGWTSLQKSNAKLLKGVSHHVAAGKSAKGSVYRLQATNLSKSEAESICAKLKAKSQSCMILAPGKN
jgi:cell division septation protein DedD